MKKAIISSVLLASACLLTSCGQGKTVEGYVEGDFTYISSPLSGQLEQLDVQRGASVKQGQLLYKLDQAPEADNFAAAQGSVQEAQAALQNLLTGERPSELAQIQAEIKQAQANLVYAQKQLVRNHHLAHSDSVSVSDLDNAIDQAQSAQATLNQLKEKLITAKLPARVQLVTQARAAVQVAIANMKKAQWSLQQKIAYAPINGFVFDDYYRVGEQVPADHPVLSILAPQNIYAVFFVPETDLHQLKLGQTVKLSCDECTGNNSATITYISPQEEFTPPIIYSNDQRSKLVYRVEAHFPTDQATNWHPGQPISVTLPQ